MTTDPPPLRLVERAIQAVGEDVLRVPAERSWQQRGERDLWNVLVACILGSGVSHEHASRAMARLSEGTLLQAWSTPFDPDATQSETSLLLAPRMSEDGGRVSGYRFARSRSRWLTLAAMSLYGSGPTLQEMLARALSPADARSAIIRKVPGIGPKQASLFLRNVGYSDDLAVIDRHVMRYMEWSGLAIAPVSPALGLARYLAFEARLRSEADRFRLPLGVFDLAVWIVVRTCLRGDA